MNPKIKHIMVIAFFITICILICVNENNNLYPQYMVDERIYLDITLNSWSIEGIKEVYNTYETKPLPFLAIWKLCNSDRVWTRAFNFTLVLINTFLLYLISKNKLAILYPLILVFLNSMWLTVETIEVLFILLAFRYKDVQGWLIGLAAIFRPYSAFYIILLNNKHRMRLLAVGGLYAAFLLCLGLFVPYLNKMFRYGVTEHIYNGNDYVALFMMIPLVIACLHHKEMLMWGIIACIPLLVKMFGHYFVTPYTLFFLGYLLWSKMESDKVVGIDNSHYKTIASSTKTQLTTFK